jgi:hypothetical protein
LGFRAAGTQCVVFLTIEAFRRRARRSHQDSGFAASLHRPCSAWEHHGTCPQIVTRIQ